MYSYGSEGEFSGHRRPKTICSAALAHIDFCLSFYRFPCLRFSFFPAYVLQRSHLIFSFRLELANWESEGPGGNVLKETRGTSLRHLQLSLPGLLLLQRQQQQLRHRVRIQLSQAKGEKFGPCRPKESGDGEVNSEKLAFVWPSGWTKKSRRDREVGGGGVAPGRSPKRTSRAQVPGFFSKSKPRK